MAKLLEEGNLATGTWMRRYYLDTGLFLNAFASGHIGPSTDPEREWGGVLGREGSQQYPPEQNLLEESGALQGLATWETFSHSGDRFFKFRQKDFDKILKILDSSDTFQANK